MALRSKLQEFFPTLGIKKMTKGESQSNGLIESYIGKIEAQARTMRSALDRHYPFLHSRHPVLMWMGESNTLLDMGCRALLILRSSSYIDQHQKEYAL